MFEGSGEAGRQMPDIDLRVQDRAYPQIEKYKEGKFILEKNLMMDVV